MTWFDVDRAGLAAQLERRGKAFAVFELVQNAWDSGSDRVEVRLVPVEGQPYAVLEVEDWSADGFLELSDSYTMFARSKRAADPRKRGRFCLGEKSVLALCRSAEISTTTGTVHFSPSGRRRDGHTRERGTLFHGELRMTREDLAAVEAAVRRLVPPVPTIYNGVALEAPAGGVLRAFTCRLPTEYADPEGVLRRSLRVADVEVYADDQGAPGEVLEMGIPVVEADLGGYRVNVLQKVPLNLDRDNVTPGFLRALRVAVLNEMAPALTHEQACEPWAQEAAADARVTPEAFKAVAAKRFGERAVIAVPGDPLANANAEAAGFTVIHGGAMPAGAWANARKFEAFQPSSRVFPTPKPDDVAASRAAKCPTCGR